jgi:twitching motility protein PilT
MEQGDLEGMQTFDGVLEKLFREGVIKREEALSYASNPGNLLLRLSDMGAVSAAQAAKKPAAGGSMLDMIE